jgi:hypothetical protein
MSRHLRRQVALCALDFEQFGVFGCRIIPLRGTDNPTRGEKVHHDAVFDAAGRGAARRGAAAEFDELA